MAIIFAVMPCFLRFRHTFAGVWLVCTTTILFAQQLSYTQFLPSDGLPSTTVYYAMQDRSGYIWFATDKGVSRFDGYHFQTFTTNDGLGDNEIFDIFEDRDGKIWFAGYNGEISWYHQGKFLCQKNGTLPIPPVTPRFPCLKVLQDTLGQIHVAYHGYMLRVSGASMASPPFFSPNFSFLVHNSRREVITSSHAPAEITFRNLTTGASWTCPLPEDTQLDPSMRTKATMVGSVLYYCTNNKVVQAEEGTHHLEILTELDVDVLSVADAGNGHLWIGTDQGLYLFSLASKRVVKTLLKGAGITDVMTDHEGNLWATSISNGVYLFVNQEVVLLDSRSGLSFDRCESLSVTSPDELIIGGLGYQCAFVRGNTIIPLQLPVLKAQGKIRRVRRLADGQYLVLSGARTIVLSRSLNVKQLLYGAFRDACMLDSQRLALGEYSGVSEISCYKIYEVYDYKNYKKNYRMKDRLISKISHTLFFKNEKGNVFSLGSSGILQRTASGWLPVPLPEAISRDLSDMEETLDGTRWVASRIGGVYGLAPEGGGTFYGPAQGLPSTYVTSLAHDDAGGVWVGTINGLAYLSPVEANGKKTWKVEVFTTGNGLISNSINDVAVFQGKVWAATDKGVCVFSLQGIRHPQPPPKLLITQVAFQGAAIPPQNGLYQTRFSRNALKISFTAIAPSAFGAITYQYRLADQDTTWSITSNTELEYPTLAPGLHVFEIRALNRTGMVSAVQQIRIYVAPVFWQTWWFRLVGLLLSLALAGGLVYLRVRALDRAHRLREYLMQLENDKLTSAFDEVTLQRKMLELEQKALLLHMNPHFVFNSINAIHGFYASGEPDLGRKYISRFSQLLRTILDFSSQKRISLRQETDMLDLYLTLNQLRFEDTFDFSLETDASLDRETTTIPPMLIQPFVENALLHGIAPLKRKGHIHIRLRREGEWLVCEVEDNGIGRVRARTMQEGRIHRSTGIAVTEDRIRLHNGLPPGPVVEITDLYGPDQQPCGTLVRFRILAEMP